MSNNFEMPTRDIYYDIEKGAIKEVTKYEKKVWKYINKIRNIIEKEKGYDINFKTKTIELYFEKLEYYFEREQSLKWERQSIRKGEKELDNETLLQLACNYIDRNFILSEKDEEIKDLTSKMLEYFGEWALIYKKKTRKDEDMYDWMKKIEDKLNMYYHISDEKGSYEKYKEYVKNLAKITILKKE